jgi:hypothetical protein
MQRQIAHEVAFGKRDLLTQFGKCRSRLTCSARQ